MFADYLDSVGSVGVWLSVGGYLRTWFCRSDVRCQVHNGLDVSVSMKLLGGRWF